MARSQRNVAKPEGGLTERKPHHEIEWLEVTGGFLKGVRLELADGLNAVIGGRGAGKTSVLEMIRYVLGAMPDDKVAQGRARAIKTLVQSNLGSGRVRIGVTNKHGMGYRAQRAWGEEPEVSNQQGEAVAISLDRELVFKVDVYSQHEIEEIALKGSLQLALIDKFIEEDARRLDTEIRQVQRHLLDNGRGLVELDNIIRDHGDTAADVRVVEEKLKALEHVGGGVGDQINRAHVERALREKERKTFEALQADVAGLGSALDSAIDHLARRLESRIDPEILAGPNGEVFRVMDAHVHELVGALRGAANRVREQAASVEQGLGDQQGPLASAHAKQEAAYRELIARSEEETGRAAERSQLQARHAEVSAAIKELALRKSERRGRDEARQELLAKLSRLRDQRFRLRKQVAERLSEAMSRPRPTIRVTVTQAANRDLYRSGLSDALKAQGMKPAAFVDKIVQGTSPGELSMLVQRGDVASLADRTQLDPERAKRVVEALRGTDALYSLETVEVEDVPRIQLLDGGDYKDSTQLSTGQRCTTILPILLLESERPLLIDQPEDNLDNAFIYETIVPALKAAKGRRQMLFVTHNPNIPVLGDADRVFVLGSDGKQARVDKVGGVDELKSDVELLLEGGREAFLERKKRYGY